MSDLDAHVTAYVDMDPMVEVAAGLADRGD